MWFHEILKIALQGNFLVNLNYDPSLSLNECMIIYLSICEFKKDYSQKPFM